MAQKRRVPRFAQQTFREWFSQRAADGVHKEKVILWVDTFTNYFEPAIPIAATEVLEKLGFQVVIPFKELCCGRPLYDFGFLKPAKNLLLNILNHLRAEIREGIPIIGLEPSCVATFRDEMTDLLPHDQDALRLKQQTFLLSEFLVKRNKLDELPALMRPALVQIHCHHHAVMKMDAEQTLFKKLGLEFEILNAGCCGMAGSFGYESGEKYQVSVKAAERGLAPAIRKTSKDTLIIADGFSCRTQIYDQTGRKALHSAEVIKIAMESSGR